MRRTWVGIHGLAAVLLSLLGCQHAPEANLKPPLQEDYHLPPADDARFSQPIAYPKESLNADRLKRDAGLSGAGFKTPPRIGAGPGGVGGF